MKNAITNRTVKYGYRWAQLERSQPDEILVVRSIQHSEFFYAP